MKKIMCLLFCVSVLCACSSMQGLRINNPNLPKGKQHIDEGLYYNDRDMVGHSEKVKHIITGKDSAQIHIPVKYNVKQNVEIPNRLPKGTKEALKIANVKEVGKCWNPLTYHTPILLKNDDSEQHCLLTPNILILKLQYYKENGAYVPLNEEFNIVDNWVNFNADNLGINTTYKAEPDYLKLSCSSINCVVLDKNENIVNEIIITKQIIVNEKRINELITKEKKEAEQIAKEWAEEEAKRKAKEAKAKEEEERRWRQKQRLQKKECPNLYRTLYWAQQTGYIDPLIGIKTAKRFEELDCQWWLQDQMNQAMY